MRVNISILSPNHLQRSGPWGELIILSHTFPGIPDSLDEIEVERLMQQHRHEWSAIFVPTLENEYKVSLWRSLTSAFEIYYTLKDSTLFISDSFAGCAANLTKQERYPSEDTIIDHFLFRTTFGETTYFENVHRVGHAMRVTLAIGKGTIKKEQFTRFSPQPKAQTEERCLENIDSALEVALGEFRGNDHTLLFSGGVDSTLLATYLPTNPLATNKITSPEFAAETSYAQSAASLLGKEIEVNVLLEEDYLFRLEEITDRLWMPVQHPQAMLLASAFKSPRKNFVVGQYADGLFGGFSAYKVRVGPLLAKPVIAQMLGLLALLPLRKFKNAWNLARAFRTPPSMPGSFAFQFVRDPKLSTLERFISRADIDRRLTARFEYISQFVGFETTGSGLDAQLETGQQIDYFCDNTVSVWRQIASSYGKTLYAPFLNSHVFDTAMSIPSSMRYMDDRMVKHLLKKLLLQRLPAYPVNQRKLSGLIPYQRFAVDGPLAAWLERYPRPDFLDDSTLTFMHATDRAAFWHTIIYSVWKARIGSLQLTPPPVLSLEIKP